MKIMNRKNARLYGQALAGIRGVSGYAVYGATTKATLYVGLRQGLEAGPTTEGKLIPRNTAMGAIAGRRIAQVGYSAASSTTSMAEGVYQGKPEPTLKVEIAFTREPDETTLPKFRKNIQALAENVAKDLGQREVLIEWMVGGKKTETATASPKGAPAPTSDAFCGWIRKNSSEARTLKTDRCYEAPKPRKKAR